MSAPRRHAALALLSLSLLAGAAQGDALLLSGSFTRDDQRYLGQFSLGQSGQVQLRSLGYAGAAAQAVAAGGFATVLALFDAAGQLLQLDSGSAHACGAGLPDPASGYCWDAAIDVQLAAGDYRLVLSQDGNLPLGPGLADGYLYEDASDYSGWAYLGQGGRRFVNANGQPRDGHWALLLDGAAPRAVPEPAAPALLALAMLLLCLLLPRRRPFFCPTQR